jgi:nucleotide-binding universal stress UspA family protein
MRRIAVTLDALQVSAQALEQAVRLAQRMGAELEGIFIEDIDLIEIAALPFVRELRPVSRSENDIDLARMEQELRALARRAERLLSEQAERHNVTWSFRIWRGSIDSDLLAADIGADVLALSRLGAALTRSKTAAGKSSAVTVLYSGGDASRRVLDTAIKLASDPQKELIILFHTDDEAEAGRLQEMATRQLQDTAAEAYFIRLTDGALADLIEIMRQTHTAVLVIERDNKLLQTPSLKHCLDSLNCPLLIVR